MPEIYVIRPTQRAAENRGVPDAAAIVEAKCAVGFVGNLARVNACDKIIITDGSGYIQIADIVKDVKSCEPMKGQKLRRVKVEFTNPQKVIGALRATIKGIKWTSSNIRYL